MSGEGICRCGRPVAVLHTCKVGLGYTVALVILVSFMLGFLVGAASAQPAGCTLPGSTAKDCATVTHRLAAEITIIGKPDDAKIFDMDENACLRGGLTFYELDGKVIFDLKPGVYYPAGCEKQ